MVRSASVGVTIGMLSKELRSSRSLSPETIRSTCVARARASTSSSSGSRQTGAGKGAGAVTSASACGPHAQWRPDRDWL
jgi:hypothetical protein